MPRMRKLGVFALIRNRKREVLLVRQKNGKKYWSLPGGKMALRERILATLRRELLEETGYRVVPVDLAMVLSREVQNYLVLVFHCRTRGKHFPSFEKHTEIAELRYFPTNELPSPLSPQARAFFRQLKKQRRPNTPFVQLLH